MVVWTESARGGGGLHEEGSGQHQPARKPVLAPAATLVLPPRHEPPLRPPPAPALFAATARPAALAAVSAVHTLAAATGLRARIVLIQRRSGRNPGEGVRWTAVHVRGGAGSYRLREHVEELALHAEAHERSVHLRRGVGEIGGAA